MSSVFDAENLEARDIGTYYNSESHSFDTKITMSIGENGDLDLMFEDEHYNILNLSFPIERLKLLLAATEKAL